MAVALLRKITGTPYWSFYTALLIFFLILGSWLGVLVMDWIPFDTLPSREQINGTDQANPLTPNGQRNLLIIGVDSLEEEKPVLESLWLVLYFPGRSPIILMPLYPRAGEPETGQDGELRKAFSLAASGDPSALFFERLGREQVWWNGYILLDERALAVLLDLVGGVDLNGQHLDARQALTSIPKVEVDEAGALAGQVRLLRLACAQAGKDPSKWAEAARLAEEQDSHLRTDLEFFGLLRDFLQAAGTDPNMECEFPLLEAR